MTQIIAAPTCCLSWGGQPEPVDMASLGGPDFSQHGGPEESDCFHGSSGAQQGQEASFLSAPSLRSHRWPLDYPFAIKAAMLSC